MLATDITVSGLKISQTAEDLLYEQVKADYPGEENPAFDEAYADARAIMRQSAVRAPKNDIFRAIDQLTQHECQTGLA